MKPPPLHLRTQQSLHPRPRGPSCVGVQGLRHDYPEVGGGQQLQQLLLVTVHGGGLQLLHHL